MYQSVSGAGGSSALGSALLQPFQDLLFLAAQFFGGRFVLFVGGLEVTLFGPLVAVFAGVGLLSEMSALQRRPATQVVPIVFVLQICVPVLLAPVLGGESWSGTPLGGVVLVAFLGAVAAGAWLLGSARGVSGLVARAEVGG